MKILRNNNGVKDTSIIEGVELTGEFIKKYILHMFSR